MDFKFYEKWSVEAKSKEFIRVLEKLEMCVSQPYELIVLIKIKDCYCGVTFYAASL